MEGQEDLLWGLHSHPIGKSKTALSYQPKPLDMEVGRGYIRQQTTTSLWPPVLIAGGNTAKETKVNEEATMDTIDH